MKGECQCFNDNIIGYYALAMELLDKFLDYDLIPIARYENSKANELGHMASRYRISKELAKVIVTEARFMP